MNGRYIYPEEQSKVGNTKSCPLSSKNRYQKVIFIIRNFALEFEKSKCPSKTPLAFNHNRPSGFPYSNFKPLGFEAISSGILTGEMEGGSLVKLP